MTRHVWMLAAAALVAAPWTAAAQPERLSNAETLTRALQGSLERELRALASVIVEPAWIAYAVPSADREHSLCCYGREPGLCCEGCRLEPRPDGGAIGGATARGPVRLEGGRTLLVFYRAERGQIDRIRIFSEDCAIDAGGRTVHWLAGVTGAESVTLLASLTTADATRRLTNAALTAIAMHGDPTAVDALVAAARRGTTAHLRGQALFWLSQRAADTAIGAISDAIDRDPDTAVKRQAVFALSQLPADQGVPRLIDLARSHSNAVVRRQAMFWLGQSKDPRALSFFEEILQR